MNYLFQYTIFYGLWRFFYGMLDQAGINAFILYYLQKNVKIHRREFIKELIFDLVQIHLKKT